MRQEKVSGWYGLGALTILIVGLVAGMAFDRVVALGFPLSDARPSFKLISQAWTLIHRYYVDRGAERAPALTYGAISGMVNALGDTGHSRFLDPSMVKQLTMVERNQYQGVGAEVQSKGGHVVIVAPLDGSPAQRAGLKAGDIILQVNGRNIAGRPLEQVIAEILGPAGTSVTLTILTPASGETRQVTLTRAKVHLDNVTWQTLPGTRIVHLRIAAFNAGAATDLRKALTDINQESPAGLILDLRNDPGGLLSEAVASASQFLKTGNVLLVRNAKGEEKPVPVKAGGEATGIPVVALVNGGTASGAEIMAGALQDPHRAQLVGETTFGTGTVLSAFKLADGSALMLAIEEWLTPAGHVIWHKGITPNVVVPLAAGATPEFPEAERTMTAVQLRNSRDAQLLRALGLLTVTSSR